ncbi:MAG: DNA gyrase inhibitor YacG [Rhodobacterales bacterium CG_4_9_14_3_um_filter_71_31]|nr:MAG: DNA gyrase inhibitor YacG [Rhodobacterales bacterium CG_4_9_14_3_um_filter_71_31]
MAEKTPACPICGKPRAQAFRPFCSRRCADVDLAKWFRGDYAVPAEDQTPDDAPPADAPPADTPGERG